jgi:hypothetical protein
MTTHEILAEIDDEISRLQRVKYLLAGENSRLNVGTATSFVFGANSVQRKRKPFSKVARAKIAAAQRKRWAKQKAATKKAA